MTQRKRRNQFRQTQWNGRHELKLLGRVQKRNNGKLVINERQSQGLIITLWTRKNPQSRPDDPADMWAAKELDTSRAASCHDILQHIGQTSERGMGDVLTATLGLVIFGACTANIRSSIFGCVRQIAKKTLTFIMSVCLFSCTFVRIEQVGSN